MRLRLGKKPPCARTTPCFFCGSPINTDKKGPTEFRTDTFKDHFIGNIKKGHCAVFKTLACKYHTPTQAFAKINALGEDVLIRDPILWLEDFDFYQFGDMLKARLQEWARTLSDAKKNEYELLAWLKAREMDAASFTTWLRWWREAQEEKESKQAKRLKKSKKY